MTTRTFTLLGMFGLVLLTACAGPASTAGTNASTWLQGQLEDDQAGVTVSVTPLYPSANAGNLEFELSLDTHSVDLSMDLTVLATLSTDTGLTVSPISWDGLTGGHHISGIMSFPSQFDGVSLLDGVQKFTLLIRDIGGVDRYFSWFNE